LRIATSTVVCRPTDFDIVNMQHISIVAAMLGLWSGSTFALPESRDASAHVCNNCTNASTEPYVLAPAPWELKASVAYVVPMIGLAPDAPVKAFAPLERNSSYATSGQLLASTGLMLIIRYNDSPVGPYDEFIVMPGLYNNPEDGLVPRLRISRIYVSHKYTAWNGRNSKLCPKQMLIHGNRAKWPRLEHSQAPGPL
jgi:hypothetical protein